MEVYNALINVLISIFDNKNCQVAAEVKCFEQVGSQSC